MLILVQLTLLFSSGLIAQQNPEAKDSRHFERIAIKAYQDKDFSAYLENMKVADKLAPNHPRITYNLASAYALNGSGKEALATLRKVANMGLYYELEKDDDFNSLKDNSDFRSILRTITANKHPVGRAEQAFIVPEKGLVPESIAFDRSGRTFYIASVSQRRILSSDGKGTTAVFADERSGLWSVLGIKVDPERQHLWAATAALAETPDLKESERGVRPFSNLI